MPDRGRKAMRFRRKLGVTTWAGLLGIAAALQGCGGGGDGTVPAPPTALPSSVAVTATATAEPGAQVRFASDLTSPAAGLSFSWDFGDGQQAHDATPAHAYAQPGDYAVVLSVTNEAGAKLQARWTVTVRRSAMLQGGACSVGSTGGWCWQRPRPTGSTLYDIQWLDAAQAWAVGQSGTILHSSDGGNTWQAQVSGVSATLRKVAFFDRLNGWAVGDENTVLHTRDGGAHWQAQASGEYGYGYGFGSGDGALRVLGTETAMLLSAGGTARVTRDGGDTWNVAAENVSALSADGTLWRLGYGSVARSTDRGASFTTVLVAPNANSNFSRLRIGDGVAWLVATDYSASLWPNYSQTLWITADAGASWQSRPLSNLGGSVDNLTLYADGRAWLATNDGGLLRSTDMGQTFTAVGPPGNGATPAYIYNLTVLGPSSATLVSGSNGQRYLTRDGGQTWQTMTLPSDPGTSGYIESLRLQADGSLWLTSSGRHYRSTDQGNTWRQLFGSAAAPNGGATALSALWFLDAQQGLAVSSGGWAAETANGGLAWTAKALTPSAQYSSGRGQVQFVSASLGWMSLGGPALYRSDDGGKSWFSPLTAAISNAVRGFHFVGASQGFALLDDRRILRSTDGGGNWETASTLPMDAQSLRFLDAQTGVVVGSSGYITRTTDGGSHWTARASGTSMDLRRVTVTPAGVLWAVGGSGTLLRSDDRGLTWTRLPSLTTATLHDVTFADARTGWAVGDSGVVLATRDGGATWQPQVTSTSATLLTVFALDAYTAWIATGDGGVLATGTGGQ